MAVACTAINMSGVVKGMTSGDYYYLMACLFKWNTETGNTEVMYQAYRQKDGKVITLSKEDFIVV